MFYYIITYGCQMNKSDSERIATVLESSGYKATSKINEADLIMVNMCSVRQSAVDRVYGQSRNLKKLKAQNPKLKIILTGCILKSDRRKLAKVFDLILSIKNLQNLPQLLKSAKKYNKTKNYLEIQPKYQANFRAFIPVSNGCNNFCSYCVVPYTRGPLVCRPHQAILEEVKSVIQKGFKEVWLLGQNVNDYQSPTDPSINFAKLLKMVDDIPGNFQLYFLSSNPKDFSDELIEVMAKSKKFAKYLNLPVQSGDNEILKKMNRSYTIE